MIEIATTNSKAIPMFSALDRKIPPGPPDVTKVIEVAGKYDVKFHLKNRPTRRSSWQSKASPLLQSQKPCPFRLPLSYDVSRMYHV